MTLTDFLDEIECGDGAFIIVDIDMWDLHSTDPKFYRIGTSSYIWLTKNPDILFVDTEKSVVQFECNQNIKFTDSQDKIELISCHEYKYRLQFYRKQAINIRHLQ